MFHPGSTMDFNFHFNYTDDKRDDNFSIIFVIAQFLLCPCVLCVSLNVIRNTNDLIEVKYNTYLLVLHNSAVERHFPFGLQTV